MYQLFTRRFDSSNAVLKPAAFEYVRRTYENEIKKIIHYYNTRVYAVKSDHFLCRLLTTATVPISYDLQRYMEVVYARGPYVAKYFKLTSDIDYGRVHKGTFYGEGCEEIVLYNEEPFNPYQALRNWKELEPIQVLEHPVSDLGLLLPNGNENSSAKGLCSVTINLAMLLVMYRGFLQEEHSKRIVDDAGSKLAVTHFVHMYVLPSMMRSHMDIIILNRLKNLFYGSPMSESLKRLPFHVTDYSRTIDSVLEDVLKHVYGKGLYYFSTLKSIPSVFKEDAQDLLIMPDIARTRQAWWAMILSRLNTMKFLLDVGQERGRRANSSLLNKLQTDLSRLERDNYMQNIVGDEISYEINDTVQDILKL